MLYLVHPLFISIIHEIRRSQIMANFTPVRYSGTPNTPVSDGQMLVDRDTGLVAFDIGKSRVRPNNIYGVLANISAKDWSPSGDVSGTVEVNASDISGNSVPNGYMIVGASLLSGSQYTVKQLNNSVIIGTDTATTCTALLFCIPGETIPTSDTLDSVIVTNGDARTYALSDTGDSREWAETQPSIDVSGDIFIINDETATGGDRVWSI